MESIIRPSVCQRTVPPTIRERLFSHSQGIKEIIKACRVWDGIQYPPPGTNELFNGVICRLRVGPSKISGRGTFLIKGTLAKHELLGVYEGILTLMRGPFVMDMFKGIDLKSIDGDPNVLGFESPFGMMNEDLYQGVPNVEVLPSGMFRAVRDIAEGEELVIRYSTNYNWNGLKEMVFNDLSREIAVVIPEMWNWIPKSWHEVKLNRDHISRWIKKIIDGSMEELETLSLHSSSNFEPIENPRDILSRFLTSGITARKFNFRIWKREERIWASLPYDRDMVRRGKFSQRWTNRKLMDIPFETVVEDNPNIRDFTRQVRLMVKPKASKLTMCPAVLVKSGDIKVSLDLGKKRLEKHLKALNNCRNAAQLRQYVMNNNVWRVTFMNNPADEEEYPGGGWCGYLAIDQIVRKAVSPSRYREPEGARNLIGTLKDLAKFGIGSFRANWRSLKNGVIRSPKETVLSVIETLEQASFFIPVPPLLVERWIPLAILQGLCSQHKFLIWKEDPGDPEFNTLLEGPISAGSVTNPKEWYEICKGQIMANRSHHYYVRGGNWGQDLSQGLDKAIERLRMLLGLPEGPAREQEIGEQYPTTAREKEGHSPSTACPEGGLVEVDLAGNSEDLAVNKDTEGIIVSALLDNREVNPLISVESSPCLKTSDGTIPNQLELKVVFWNANTWKSQNLEKLMDTITGSNADVVCISDARLDAFKDRYIGG